MRLGLQVRHARVRRGVRRRSQGAPEQCDGSDLAGTSCVDLGFYDAAGLACSATCTFDTSHCTGFCGDGVVNGPEVCDGGVFGACSGFDFGGLRCGHDCTIGTDECGFEGWRRLTSPARQIGGLWAAGHDDFYAASTEGLLHFHGTAWELLIGAPPAVLVEGRSPQDFVVAGTDGRCTSPTASCSRRWGRYPVASMPSRRSRPTTCGSSATRSPASTRGPRPRCRCPGSPPTRPPRGSRTRCAWPTPTSGLLGTYVDAATGRSTTVAAHFDGAAWTAIAQPPELGPVGLWASSAHDLWIAGAGGQAAHFDGTAWTVIAIDPDDPPPGPVTDIVGSGISDVLAIGTYAPVTPSTPVTFAYRWDGARWQRLPDVPFAIAGVVGFAGAVMGRSAVDDDAAFFSRGVAEWLPAIETTLHGSNGTESLGALQAFAPDDAYTLGSTGLLHWDGAGWTPATALDFDASCLWGATTTDLWIGGDGDLVHWDGAAVTSFRTAVGGAPNINALFGTATDDVWASDVASPPHLWHFDGAQWTALPAPPGVVRGSQGGSQPLAVSGPSDVWALVSEQGAIRLAHYDGTSWHVLAPNDDPDGDFILNGVFASSPTDAWVVANSHIFHSDGASLVDADPPIPVADEFQAIVGTAPDDLFAVGVHAVLHFDGAQWSPVAVQAPGVAFFSTASATSAGLLVERHVLGPRAVHGDAPSPRSVGVSRPRDRVQRRPRRRLRRLDRRGRPRLPLILRALSWGAP